MTVVKFQIATRRSGEYRTISVIVYDDLGQMRRDATRWGKLYSANPNGYFDQALGVAHRWNGTKRTSAGIIRLWRGALGAGLIAHEVTHLAIGIYQHDCNKDLFEIENEEILCHLIGELNAKLCAALWKRKFYEKEGNEHGE